MEINKTAANRSLRKVTAIFYAVFERSPAARRNFAEILKNPELPAEMLQKSPRSLGLLSPVYRVRVKSR